MNDSATPHCQREPYRRASPEVAAAMDTWTEGMHAAALINFKQDISTGGRGVVPRQQSLTPTRRSERGHMKARSMELERDREENTLLKAEVATLQEKLSNAPDAADIRKESRSEVGLLKKQLLKCQGDLKTAQKKRQPGLSPAQKGANTKARKAREVAEEQLEQLTDRLSEKVALYLRCFCGPSTHLHSSTRASVVGNRD
jgi:hypothetical protein